MAKKVSKKKQLFEVAVTRHLIEESVYVVVAANSASEAQKKAVNEVSKNQDKYFSSFDSEFSAVVEKLDSDSDCLILD